MAAEYKLSYTASEIDEKLGKIDDFATKEEVNEAINNSQAIPDYIKTSAEEFAHTIQERQSGNSFTFAFMSDGHVTKSSTTTVKSATHAGQALSIINKRVPLDFVVHGGDYTWGSASDSKEIIYDDFELYQQLIGSAAPDVPNIYVQGNHDDLPYQATANRLTQSETFGTIGRKNWLANAVCEAGKNYGYVDFESQKVRVIFIDTEDKRFLKTPEGGCYTTTKVVDGEEKTTYNYFLNFHNVTKQQLDFIVEKALDFSDKDDYAQWSIVVVSHLHIGAGVNWWKYDGENSGEESSEQCRVFVSSVANILKAYKEGTTYTDGITSVNDDGTYTLVDDLTYDFTNTTNRVQNIIAVNGDGHICREDEIKCEGQSSIWVIHCPNIVNGREATSGDGVKYTKTADTGNGTAFRVITIDRENKKIYADCYGAGYSKELSYGTEQNEEPTPVIYYTTEGMLSEEEGIGYIKDYRLVDSNQGSRSEVFATTGYELTNYIPCKAGDVIRLQNITFESGNDRLACYSKDSDGNYVLMKRSGGTSQYDAVFEANNDSISNNLGTTVTTDENGVISIPLSWATHEYNKNIAAIRICSSNITADSIITIEHPNLLDFSKVTNNKYLSDTGSDFDGDDDTDLSSGSGFFTTDFIPVNFNGNNTATVRTSGIHMFPGLYDNDVVDVETGNTLVKFRDANYGKRKVALYDANKVKLMCTANLKNLGNTDATIGTETINTTFNGTALDGESRVSATLNVADYTNNIKWNIPSKVTVTDKYATDTNTTGTVVDVAYMRICSDVMGADSIITINKEIVAPIIE